MQHGHAVVLIASLHLSALLPVCEGLKPDYRDVTWYTDCVLSTRAADHTMAKLATGRVPGNLWQCHARLYVRM